MSVTISYDSAAMGREGGWVVNQKSGGGFLSAGVSDQTTRETQSEAISAARNMADNGEQIVLNKKSGGSKVIREGE